MKLYGSLVTDDKQPRTLGTNRLLQGMVQTESFRLSVKLTADNQAEVWLVPLVDREPVVADMHLVFSGHLPTLWRESEAAAPLSLHLFHRLP